MTSNITSKNLSVGGRVQAGTVALLAPSDNHLSQTKGLSG